MDIQHPDDFLCYQLELAPQEFFHALEDLASNRRKPMNSVLAGVMPHNIASIRVLEEVGFEKEGLSKKNVLINGTWEDHWHFAIVSPND